MNSNPNESDRTILEYRSHSPEAKVHTTLPKITVNGCATVIGALFLGIVVAVAALWIYGNHIDFEEMRQDLPGAIKPWANGSETQYEIRHVFSGSATKFYRVKATPAAANQLMSGLSADPSTFVHGDAHQSTDLPPDWWKPESLSDIREYNSVPWAHIRYWISPSTGWVYMYVEGH